MNDEFKMYEDKLKMADTGGYTIKGFIPSPFSITFSWEGESITIELKEGKDVLKLASVFSLMLTENGIEHNIKQQSNEMV
jgi:hypothetical protein